MKVTVKAPAKVNLALDIIGVDGRGYHLMNMLMQTIDLYDTVTLWRRDDGKITLDCDREGIPQDERNICVRCAKAFFKAVHLQGGVSIAIQKVIPQQAGMAGGSADGAATLVGLNELFQTNLSLDTLCEIGAAIGADIPFCLVGGTAKVTGFGEVIEKVADFPDCSIVVAKPKAGISTERAFADFDRLAQPPKLDLDQMIDHTAKGDLVAACEMMYNALELVCPLTDLTSIKSQMRSFGAKGALMTGSGSAVFGIFTDRSKAYLCEQKLKQKYTETFLCKPINHGAIVT